MQLGRKLRFVPVALVLLIVFLTSAQAFGASSGGQATDKGAPPAQAAQSEPAVDVDTGPGGRSNLDPPTAPGSYGKAEDLGARRTTWLATVPQLEDTR